MRVRAARVWMVFPTVSNFVIGTSMSIGPSGDSAEIRIKSTGTAPGAKKEYMTNLLLEKMGGGRNGAWWSSSDLAWPWTSETLWVEPTAGARVEGEWTAGPEPMEFPEITVGFRWAGPVWKNLDTGRAPGEGPVIITPPPTCTLWVEAGAGEGALEVGAGALGVGAGTETPGVFSFHLPASKTDSE
jgi:hypothetical protein